METSAGQGEHGTGKSVKGSIRKIPSESVIRLWRNFLRQCLIRGLEVDFCSLPFRKKLYRRSIKNPNPFPIWKIWFGLYAFGAGGGGRTRTFLRTRDFESRASANSTTPAGNNRFSIANFPLKVKRKTRINRADRGSGRSWDGCDARAPDNGAGPAGYPSRGRRDRCPCTRRAE